MSPDTSATLNRDGFAVEIFGSPTLFRRGLNGAKNSVRRNRRRISGFASETRDMIGLEVHEVHVSCRRADILSSDVATAKTFDEPAVCSKNRFTVFCSIVADDHGFSAAEIQAGNGILVCHSTREAQSVDDRFIVGRVTPESRATEC